MDGWMEDGWMEDGWFNGWMDGWLDGSIDGWMDGWLDGHPMSGYDKLFSVIVTCSFLLQTAD